MTRMVLLLLAASALARGPVQGYWKLYCTAADWPTQPGPMEGAAFGLLRLERKLSLGPAQAELAWELRPAFGGEGPDIASGSTLPSPYRIDALGGRIYPRPGDSAGSFRLRHGPDRASLSLDLGGADLIVGRQAVYWGSGRLLRPTDFPAPVGVSALESEDRAGVDALRLRWALGMMSELDAGVLAGPDADPDSSAAWLRYRTYVARTDAAVLAAAYQGNAMAGLDLTRPVGGAGTWLEASYSRLNALADRPEEDLWRLTAGADYSPAGDLYCALEYGFSSQGLQPSSHRGVAESGVYLPGRHYAGAELRWQASALLTASAAGLFRLDESGCWLSPALEYSLAQNVWLQGGCQLGFGDDPAGFRSWPDLAWTSFSAYF